jgi:hypothetical protein
MFSVWHAALLFFAVATNNYFLQPRQVVRAKE